MSENWPFIESIQQWVSWWELVRLLFILLAGLLATFVLRWLLRHLRRRVQASKTPWDDALFKALERPAIYGFWLIGGSFVVELVWLGGLGASVSQGIETLRYLTFILLSMAFLSRFIRESEANLIARDIDVTSVNAVSMLLRVAVFIMGGVTLLHTLGVSLSGVLAFGGMGGIAIGLAARDLIANFFGGLVIYLNRPFNVGDWIRSPDREIEGTVELIDWRQTVIRTFDLRPLYVPNAVFTTVSVENPSRMRNRRIYETIGVRYEDAAQVAAIVRSVRTLLETHPEIASEQTLIVNFVKFAPSSLDFFVYTFTRTTDWVRFHQVKQDILLGILEIVAEHGAEVAFPTSTLHLASMPEPPAEGPVEDRTDG